MVVMGIGAHRGVKHLGYGERGGMEPAGACSIQGHGTCKGMERGVYIGMEHEGA